LERNKVLSVRKTAIFSAELQLRESSTELQLRESTSQLSKPSECRSVNPAQQTRIWVFPVMSMERHIIITAAAILAAAPTATSTAAPAAGTYLFEYQGLSTFCQ
jgi:hypothetical protein